MGSGNEDTDSYHQFCAFHFYLSRPKAAWRVAMGKIDNNKKQKEDAPQLRFLEIKFNKDLFSASWSMMLSIRKMT